MNIHNKAFLENLKTQVENHLNKAGIRGIAVKTYEEDGRPKVEVSGESVHLIAAERVLKGYSAMLVTKPTDENAL